MELLHLSTEWAENEVFSTRFFILFAILFFIASLGFWQLGKTDLAKAYIIPTSVAAILLLVVGLGLFFTNKSRIKQFSEEYNANSISFYESEIIRTESTLKEYKVVFKIIPILIIVAALLILFFNSTTIRAISITAIAMLIIVLLIDGTAHSRIESYNNSLKELNLK
jgi:ABC-2 type transport system permease protein